MAFEHREGNGSLFKNDKQGVEKRPDYRGDLMVGGEVYELSAWIKEGNKGKFMSLSAKPKEAREAPQRSGKPAAAPAAFEDDPDSVPF